MPSILGVCVCVCGMVMLFEVWDVAVLSCPLGKKSDCIWLLVF